MAGDEPKQAWIRFYGELNDFLRSDLRQCVQQYDFKGSPSIVAAIEGLGVPHPEVCLLTVNGDPANFSHKVQAGDRIAVYPRMGSLQVPRANRLTPADPVPAVFVCDVNLGKLARLLRLLGFDTLFDPELDDPDLAEISVRDGRILLTRDRELLMRSEVRRGRYVRAIEPETQAREILACYQLAPQALAFSRCTRCNGMLEKTDDPERLATVPPRSRENCSEFLACTGCDRVYWQGDHYRKLEETCRRLLA